MSDVINLRRARKAKDRRDREREAEQNRRLFGRTAAEKKKEADERERARTHIERHRIVRDAD
jgi:hypothetical protein